ncbi:MAG: STAS domain-containing protein [Ignavibacteriaceae bacterium]
MKSVFKKDEKFAIVFKVNLLRATLNEASEFKDYLEEVIKDSDKDIIVNLSDCDHMDSTFLGVLVSGYKRLKKQDRNLVLIEPTDHSSIFLTLNSIGKIFPIYNNLKDALQDIENKKLLELELGGLIPKTEQKQELVKDEDFTIIENNFNKNFEETVPEIIDEKDEIKIENQEIETQNLEIESETVEEPNTTEQETIAMEETETNEEDKNLELESDIEVTEEITSLISDSEPESPIETAEPEIVAVEKDKPFKKGKVEWKFGFEAGTP